MATKKPTDPKKGRDKKLKLKPEESKALVAHCNTILALLARRAATNTTPVVFH